MVLRKELQDRLGAAGYSPEWADVLRDLESLHGGFVIAGRTTTSERAGSKVALDEHNRDVGELSRVIAANAGLNEMLTSICELAGQHHDDGKADPRFQRWLGAVDELLAKSGQTRAQIRAAGQSSGYPFRFRPKSSTLRSRLTA